MDRLICINLSSRSSDLATVEPSVGEATDTLGDTGNVIQISDGVSTVPGAGEGTRIAKPAPRRKKAPLIFARLYN